MKTCPACGRPYLPLYKAVYGTIILLCIGLSGAGVTGAVAWLVFKNENAAWFGALVGLLGGGLVGMIKMIKELKPAAGGEYCRCTDGA